MVQEIIALGIVLTALLYSVYGIIKFMKQGLRKSGNDCSHDCKCSKGTRFQLHEKKQMRYKTVRSLK